jgi:high-affinity K+ transport system ATPase subunit B
MWISVTRISPVSKPLVFNFLVDAALCKTLFHSKYGNPMSECKCQNTIDAIRLTAREGIVRELNHQISQKEYRIKALELEIEFLHFELEVIRTSLKVMPSSTPQSKD